MKFKGLPNAWGCAESVRKQIEVVKQGTPGSGLGNVLVLGSSTGYGLGSLLTTVFGYGAKALSVCFEREPKNGKGGSPGYYNLVEAHRVAKEQGKHIETIIGDAFSNEIKAEVVAALKERLGPVDCIVYSLAAPSASTPLTHPLRPSSQWAESPKSIVYDNTVGEVTIQ